LCLLPVKVSCFENILVIGDEKSYAVEYLLKTPLECQRVCAADSKCNYFIFFQGDCYLRETKGFVLKSKIALIMLTGSPLYLRGLHSYRKLVETFHVVSECKTAVYFRRWAGPYSTIQLFWPLELFSDTSWDRWTDSDATVIYRDRTWSETRHSFIQYSNKLLRISKPRITIHC